MEWMDLFPGEGQVARVLGGWQQGLNILATWLDVYARDLRFDTIIKFLQLIKIRDIIYQAGTY